MPVSKNVLFVCVVVLSAIIYYIGLSYFAKTLSSWERPAKIIIPHHDSKRPSANEQFTVEGQDLPSRYLHMPVRMDERLPEIVVAVVACGDRLDETLVMLKSALVFTDWWQPLRFIIFADNNLISSFKGRLEEWKLLVNHTLEFEVHPITFPHKGNADEWRKLFKPCASQRLFLPTVLERVDSLLYMDTDTIFLAPLRDIWSHFYLMNSSQIAALAPEHEDPNTGWYNRFAHHPYYGSLGVNSGVMLMNLTRMREFKWEEYVVPVYKEYKLKITWGDQDIINIIFHFHPDKLYVYPCRYNYRSDHCMYMSVCQSAVKDGVAVLHGSRGIFHSTKQPAFHAVYCALKEYQLGSDPNSNLLVPMKTYLDETSTTNCGGIRKVFTIAMEEYFSPHK